MYNRYIPQNGTYTRVVEQDGPEEGARRRAPPPPPLRCILYQPIMRLSVPMAHREKRPVPAVPARK